MAGDLGIKGYVRDIRLVSSSPSNGSIFSAFFGAIGISKPSNLVTFLISPISALSILSLGVSILVVTAAVVGPVVGGAAARGQAPPGGRPRGRGRASSGARAPRAGARAMHRPELRRRSRDRSCLGQLRVSRAVHSGTTRA